MSEIAYIGVGTNIEPRMERMMNAISALATVGNILKLSSIYESAPYGVEQQAPFLNAVAAIATDLGPEALQVKLKELETHLGRQKRERWHEREIDFDMLFYNNAVISTSSLIIPHADLLNRSFVLIPLAEIAPNIIHPIADKTVESLSIPFRDIPPEALRIVSNPATQ